MNVTVSVKGRFHAFDLARELQRQSSLRKLITSYPAFETVKYGIDKDKIESLLAFEIMERSWRMLPLAIKKRCDIRYFLCERYDHSVSKLIPEDSDIFVGWSSFSLHSARRSKRNGTKTIIERGSSHITHQYEIMRDEYDRFGVKGELTHPKIVEKEISEYAETDYISVPSAYVKKSFLDRGYPEQKIIHVPYGVDLKNFRRIPKQDNTFRIIHCGGLTLRKGVHYLLQAFSELSLPDAELWLIGAASREIEPFLARYAADRISHLGPFPQAILYKYYSQGSVFCLASIEEGLAMVQAQAMACGLPVICTTNTGGADIVRDTVDGFVVPIRDVNALKEKILYLYENPDICSSMGESAHNRVASGFSWDDYGKRMCQHYKRILSGAA
jgi:glycosyltransferase involved in cell wall biosynthesis